MRRGSGLHGCRGKLVVLPPALRGPDGVCPNAGDGALELGEGGVAAGAPLLQGRHQAAHGGGRDVPQGRDGADLDLLADGVQLGGQQAGVDGRDDDVLELARRRQAELGRQVGVGEPGLVAGEGQEGQLAELELLGRVQGREAGGLLLLLLVVRGVEAVGKELEVGVVGGEVGVVGQGGDGGGVEELGEDEGVGGGGGALDEVGCGAWGGR